MSKAATRKRLLAAARELVVSGQGPLPSAGAVAARAGVSRLTVYAHFGSHAGMLQALVSSAPALASEAGGLGPAILASCEHWASDPVLYRRLPPPAAPNPAARELAAALARADGLRAGCSVREAEDVISLVLSFAAFDRLHGDGRRSPAAVAEILSRLAATILATVPA